ncbi:MAG: MBL fold metallo-hydrolase [Gemmatimonadota bacterium]
MKDCTRRKFIADGVSCAAHLALAASLAPAATRALWAQGRGGRVVATEPFGRLEEVAQGVWALISTPLTGARTTVCNGGLIAGRTGVVAVEGFMTPEGARWLGTKARELTGRWPTHAVISHYHADHSNGVAGYRDGEARPLVQATSETRQAAIEKNLPVDDARREALTQGKVPDESTAATIDLGDRQVRLVRRRGHTASDVTVEVDEPSLVFTGDLVWNAMFPNYVDAAPPALAEATRALRRTRVTTYVPGHGPVATDADVGRYLAMLGEVEAAARAAHAKGTPAAEAGAAFALSPALGEWALFNKVFFERAFAAWYRELGGGDARQR